jgi:hypothetical protein
MPEKSGYIGCTPSGSRGRVAGQGAGQGAGVFVDVIAVDHDWSADTQDEVVVWSGPLSRMLPKNVEKIAEQKLVELERAKQEIAYRDASAQLIEAHQQIAKARKTIDAYDQRLERERLAAVRAKTEKEALHGTGKGSGRKR